jgi:uncharacterized membrane protein SirB2
METIVWIKHLHVTLAYLTVIGFVTRALLSLSGPSVLQQRWIKVAPHMIDTLLLAAGITLAALYRMSPLVHTWLGMKILALLLYIALGIVAFRARSLAVRLLALAGALLTVGYIFWLAYTRQVMPF